MMRRKTRTYSQEMVKPYDDDDEAAATIDGEAAAVMQRAGARWPVVVAVVVVIAIVAVVYVNRDTLAAPNIMAYSETSDPHFVADKSEAGGAIDEGVLRQRRLRMVQASLSCIDVGYTPLGDVAGLWRVECMED